MNLKLFKSALLFLMAILCATPATMAADAPVKREMRSAWVATVWRLDWPDNVISNRKHYSNQPTKSINDSPSRLIAS